MKPFLSGSSLKLLALLTMLIDHIGAILYPNQLGLRLIGRLSFPIFCFLLVEGFCHTKQLKRYLIRLGVFALISELPFDLAFYGTPFFMGHQNIFFTLFLGLCVLIGIKHYETYKPGQAAVFIVGCLLAEAFHMDYGSLGIFMIVLFYLGKGQWLLLSGMLFLMNFLRSGLLQTFAIFALVPLYFYNGRRGLKLKYGFYLFYPLHLLVLAYLRYLFIF